MKFKFFPRYTEIGASSRYRIYQYLPIFEGYEVSVHPFFDDEYSPAMSFKSLRGMVYTTGCYFKRILNILKLIKGNNICVLQYEFTPYLPFNVIFFKVFKIKYVVDYDDAVFHNYDQSKNKCIKRFLTSKIPKVIENADAIITGSPYLTEFAKRFNRNVFEIPTSIDIEKYPLSKIKKTENTKFIIGWIGSKTTSLHIAKIIKPMIVLKNMGIDFEVRLIGFSDEKISFENLPVKIIEWNASNEVEQLSQFDVGIMPMIDFPFARGKCAFKLIQYMALGKPTIASPFEANLKVDINQENLFAETEKEWVEAFLSIIEDRQKFANIGKRNREVIQKNYSIQANGKRLLNVLKSVST